MTELSLLETVRALRPMLSASRAETERTRSLAPPLVEALSGANLFRLAVPRADGGLEASALTALQVFGELASVDAAAAWIVWNHTLPAFMSRFLDADVRRALFGTSAHMMANSTRPTGQAVRERDGFHVSGRWSLVSGCELADHVLLRVLVTPPAAAPPGPPEMVMVYFPRSECRVLDTWYAGGLRGTGSHDVVVENVWAPRSHCVWFDQPSQLSAALYRMPFAATLSAGCASLCLGIAGGALSALSELAQTKLLADRGVALRDQPQLLRELARMQAAHASARLLLVDTVGAAWRSCEAGDPVSMQARANMFAAALHAASSAKLVVRTAYEQAGASALYETCPIERAHRDLHAATQHVILHELWLEEAGRVALGAAPIAPLFAV